MPFDGIEKETALHNVKELIFGFFPALGCAALSADGDHSRYTAPECSAEGRELSKAA